MNRLRIVRAAARAYGHDRGSLPQAAMTTWNRRFALSVGTVTALIVLATLAAAVAP
jgi:hypothetical protein